MLAATTPTIMINCEAASDALFEDIEKCRCEIRQGSTSPITIDGKVVSVHLTQEQTAKFLPGSAKVQLHFLLAGGTAWKTIPATIKISESLTQEVLA